MIHGIDGKILRILQDDARISNAEIARRVGLAPSAVLGRVRKLEARGVIRGYSARLDPAQLELGLTAFIFVTALEPLSENRAGEALAALPEVLEVHYIAGDDCYLAKVRVRDPEHLGWLIRDRFGAIEGMNRTRTTIVLSTLKETAELPIADETPVELAS